MKQHTYFLLLLLGIGVPVAAQDSIRVVKGQVSDYYITVTKDRIVRGRVLDEARRPLEGATVMFFASPMHCTTAADGSFAIKGAENDVHLYVYYPGKRLVNRMLDLDENDIEVLMEDEEHRAAPSGCGHALVRPGSSHEPHLLQSDEHQLQL